MHMRVAPMCLAVVPVLMQSSLAHNSPCDSLLQGCRPLLRARAVSPTRGGRRRRSYGCTEANVLVSQGCPFLRPPSSLQFGVSRPRQKAQQPGVRQQGFANDSAARISQLYMGKRDSCRYLTCRRRWVQFCGSGEGGSMGLLCSSRVGSPSDSGWGQANGS